MFFQKKDDISCKRIFGITYKDVRNMKIGEAQGIYREQVNAYREQKSVLSKRLQNIRSRIKRPGSIWRRGCYFGTDLRGVR